MKTPSLITALTLLSSSFSFAGGEGWSHDFEAAKAQAAKEGKDLLIDFTGSDWCGWCIKLSDEVFKKAPFKAGVADTFVLVELDYPQDKTILDEATIKQNEKLQKLYEPQGFPTILLTDAQGRPYAQTGYQKGGPEAYVKHLNELRGNKAELHNKFTEADKLEGVAKAKALLAALGTLEPQHHKHYKAQAEEILKLDPKDETGFKAKQEMRAAKSTLERDLHAAMDAKKPEEALSIIDTFISKYKPEGADHQEILAVKINIFMSSENLEEAGKVLDDIIAIDPNSEIGASAKAFKPQFEEMKKEAAAKKTETKEESKASEEAK